MNPLSEDHVKTVRIQRPAKVTTDERGRTVWTGGVESVELELVSTTALHKILDSGDEKSRLAIREAVSGKTEGVLARNPETGFFEIVSDAELDSLLDGNKCRPASHHVADVTSEPVGDRVQRAAEELSLVSTQVLRKVLKPDGSAAYTKPVISRKDKYGGFDPYNNN